MNLKKHGIDFETAMLVFNGLLKQKGAFIMIQTATLDRNQKPTEAQIQQIKEAAKKEILFDEDSPELTPAMEKAFRLAAKNRNTQSKINIS